MDPKAMMKSATKTVLYVEGCRDGTVGGSQICLYRMLCAMDQSRVHPIVVMYDDHTLADAIRELGVCVHVLPNRFPFDFARRADRRGGALRQMAPLVRPVQQFVNFVWYFLRPAILYARLIRRLDVHVVHLNNSLNTNHEWIIAARLARVGLVSHERGISNSLSRTALFLGRWVIAFVCISQVVRQPLLRQGLDDRKIEVVYDGLTSQELDSYQPVQDVRAAYGIPATAPVIGIVGNIKEWKGQETVVRALALLSNEWPDLRCFFVGGFAADDEFKQRLDQVVTDNGLADRVIFAGFQTRPRDFLAAMDVVVHASVNPEPFGMVNLEAMSMGKAVISTTIGGPAEIFEHGRTGLLIVPGDPQLLAEALAMLLADKPQRDRLGAAARAAVAERFTIETTLEQTYGVYARL